MTITIVFSSEDKAELASIEFDISDASLNQILDMHRERQAPLGEAPTMTRAEAAEALAQEWVRDISAQGWNHNAGKVAKVAVDALGVHTRPVPKEKAGIEAVEV